VRQITEFIGEAVVLTASRDIGDLLKNKKSVWGTVIFISRGADPGVNRQCGEEREPSRIAFDIGRR
jgi:hypothetical protein